VGALRVTRDYKLHSNQHVGCFTILFPLRFFWTVAEAMPASSQIPVLESWFPDVVSEVKAHDEFY
jgi:hypothetical protein